MARIELAGVAHRYGGAEAPFAVRPLDLTWEPGGAYALLGPSGCGKTTLLNVISGLVRPTQGRVLFDGRDVTELPPQRRNIAQVFQFPVVYDTMTVAENLAFPLRNRGVDRAAARKRAERIAELLDLSADLDRRASGLPADAKQKISLGRGLVREDVAAILLDEPLTVIDPHLKWLLRRKLRQVHEELSVTLVYVTHDQVEALTLADRVVVMNEGRVVQQGTPQELFERPADAFVGTFIGSPGMNLLPCVVEGGAAVVDGKPIAIDAGLAARAAGKPDLLLGIRPEFLRLAPGGPAATVASVEELGRHRLVTARLGERVVKLRLPEEDRVAAGAAVSLSFPPAWTRLFSEGRAL